MRFTTDTMLVLGATAGLSLKGIWARLAYANGLDVAGVLFYRAALATPLFLAFGTWMLRREARSRTVHQTRVGLGIWAIAAGLGAVFSVGMYSDFQAIAFLGAGVSRVILFGFPLVVIGVESVVRRKAPTGNRLVGFAVAWAGLVLVAGDHSPLGLGNWETGLIWGFASLILYGLFVASAAPLSQLLGSVRLTMVSNTATGVVVLSFLLLANAGALPAATPQALGWVCVMVLISTVIPYFMLTEGIRRLGGAQAGLIAMLGPPLTVGAGWLSLDETLSVAQLLGTAAVLLGVFLSQRGSRQTRVERVTGCATAASGAAATTR